MNNYFKNKEKFKEEFTQRLRNKYLVTPQKSSDREDYLWM